MGIPADILIWEFPHRGCKCLTGSGPVKEGGSDRVTEWRSEIVPQLLNLENDVSKERRLYNSWVVAYISIIFLSGPHTTELTTSFSKRWNCPVCPAQSARWYFILQNEIKNNMCYKWETLSVKKDQSLADEIVSDWSISTWLYTSTISTSQITQYELWYDYILVQIQNSSKWPWILPTLGSCTVDKKFNNLKSLTKSNKEPRKEWNLPIYLQLENFL